MLLEELQYCWYLVRSYSILDVMIRLYKILLRLEYYNPVLVGIGKVHRDKLDNAIITF